MSGVFVPATLPCGRVIDNRLVKVALYEHLARLSGGPPNEHHFLLYSRWASHGWGMIITGNVQVSSAHLSLGRDVVIPETISEKALQPFKTWAACIHASTGRSKLSEESYSNGATIRSGFPLAIMQLSHAGRQSPNFLGGRCLFAPPLAPSAVAVGYGVKRGEWGLLSSILHRLLFQTPKPMSVADIDKVVQAFVRGAQVAAKAGFDGVQLHAAHGYLLAQFMSPKTNRRTDEYSATGENTLRLLRLIVFAIRKAVPEDFVLGIKLNAGDYVDGSSSECHAIAHVCAIRSWDCVDFIEISGGDYENPEFMQRTTSFESPRQAFFAKFSHRAMIALASSTRPSSSRPQPLILLTGGLRSPAQFSNALTARHADLLGVGRGAILCPDLPEILADSLAKRHVDGNDTQPIVVEPHLRAGSRRLLLRMARWFEVWAWPRIPLVGASVDVAWYTVAMRRLALAPALLERQDSLAVDSGLGHGMEGGGLGVELDYDMTGIGAVLRMWLFIVVDQDKTPVGGTSRRDGIVTIGGFFGTLFVLLLACSFLSFAFTDGAV